MNVAAVPRDPYNVIITGVGGQGNVLASRMLGNMLARRGFCVTIGETFGVSQRGGSVMSHLRISKESVWSPQIPMARADLVVALEPIEAIRVLTYYGNMSVKVLSNTRPIPPVSVIAGEKEYPSFPEIQDALSRLAGDVRFINATEEALKLGNHILGNVIMIGAVHGLGILPFGREDLIEVLRESFQGEKIEINMKAFDIGTNAVTRQ